MGPPSQDPIQIGPHRLWRTGDLAIVEVDGDIDIAHLNVMQQASRPLFDEYGYTLTLVDARKAGAQVEVFLDQGAVDPEEGRGFNGPACAFFQGQGIPVFQDDASTVVHAKAIVIDEKTVLLGSTNWTDAALNKNLEANIVNK